LINIEVLFIRCQVSVACTCAISQFCCSFTRLAVMENLKKALEDLYAQVPATRCAGTGECCELTPEEYDDHYATMFPLFRAEYLHIVDHVETKMPEVRRRELLAFTEERPRRCPFLGADQGCTIYSVRPLICRTYGAMNPISIEREGQRNANKLPASWIRDFERREGGMVCPRVAVLEPEKVAAHARNVIDGTYERELERLSAEVEVADGERRDIFYRASGKAEWPLCWSWGGYNAVRFAPIKWLRDRFAGYWKKAVLPDAG
jgi:Fe-S-cluster containining protein